MRRSGSLVPEMAKAKLESSLSQVMGSMKLKKHQRNFSNVYKARRKISPEIKEAKIRQEIKILKDKFEG